MSERSSIPSLIVLLDFVLKVLKLCLVFDQLFRVRSEEHHQNITKQKSRFSSLYIFISLLSLDVTWSRMPANEADVCYEAAAPG